MTDSSTSKVCRVLVNGQRDGTLDPLDRGLCLGDGLFETVRIRAGHPIFWERHLGRLERGCDRLLLPVPDRRALEADLQQLLDRESEGTLRLTYTRGPGPRGYALPPEPRPTRVLTFYPGRSADPGRPLRLRWCDTRLAIQPRLAGIKHLNRLEQIFGRAEWVDPEVDEGLMMDMDGNVVECTSANLFLCLGGRLITPAVDRCGVAGVIRACVLEAAQATGIDTEIRCVQPVELGRAGEVFITNASRGLAPVGVIGERRLDAPGPIVQCLQPQVARMAST